MVKNCQLLVICLLVLLIPSLLLGQSSNAAIAGQVSDPSKAVIPKVKVTAINNDTNVRYEGVTNQSGTYLIPSLPPGEYHIEVEKMGFKTIVTPGVVLHVQHTVELNFEMEVGSISESVTVSAAAPLIDRIDPSTKQLVDHLTIDSIPLNGRNYLDLMQLQPGVAVNTNARSDLTNRDTQGSIFGERAGNTGFLVDGLENSDDFHGGALQKFTQDAIDEYQIVEAGYKAEFGRGSAGVINVLTKSGTNSVHGSGFLFLRNDALDSSNVTGEKPPALTRYDYGFTFGGPVRKDKSWFFASMEQVQEKRASIFPPNIPDLLKAGEDLSRVPQTTDNRLFGKYTQRVRQRHDIRGEFSWSRTRLLNALASPISLPSNSNNNLTDTFMGTVSVTSMFSPKVVLDNSFGVRAQNFGQNQNPSLGRGYEIFFLDDGSSFDFGPPIGSVQKLEQRYYTARQALTVLAGEKHSVKVGYELIRTVADGVNGDGLENVIVTIHPLFALYGRESFQIPQGVAFFNPGDNLTRLRSNGISAFAQDDWKVFQTLTLNVGVRYDYDSKFGKTTNFAPRFGLSFSPDNKTVIQASWGMFYDRYRLGIAQAIPELGGFNASTLVELDYPRLANDALIPFPGSLGQFAKVLKDSNFINTQFGIPPGTLVTVNNVQSLTGMSPTQFLIALNQFLGGFGMSHVPVEFSPTTGYLRQNLGANFQDQIRVARPFKTPYNNTFTVGIQRQLRPDLSISATYVHRSIRNILGVRIPNLAYNSRNIGQAITTDGGPLLRTYGPWYDGKYDGLILKVDKRLSLRFQIQASYVYSKATDDLLNANLGLGLAAQGGGAVPTDNLNLEFDRGNSDLSIPHVFVSYGIVDLPGGFRMSGIFRAISGMYFSASGVPIDYDGDGIVSTRPAGTKRNQFRSVGSKNVDVRIEKRFKFAEHYNLSGVVEFFNLTNARNPKLIDNFFQNGAPGPNFGKVRVPLPGREVQMGVRFQF